MTTLQAICFGFGVGWTAGIFFMILLDERKLKRARRSTQVRE